MKAAMTVLRIGDYPAQNIRNMCACIREAAENGAELIVFPEAAITGPVNNNSIVHDLMLGARQDSPLFDPLRDAAQYRGIDLCFGYFELFGGRMYSSALYLNRRGEVLANYRRQSSEWRDYHVRGVYAEGTAPAFFDSPFGRTALLIGGDLLDDFILDGVMGTKPDLLLLPSARRFQGWRENPARLGSEAELLLQRARKFGAPLLVANCMGGDLFGGAYAFGESGAPLACLEPGRPGLLYCSLEPPPPQPPHIPPPGGREFI